MIDSLLSNDSIIKLARFNTDTVFIHFSHKEQQSQTFGGLSKDTWATIIIPIAIFMLGLIIAYVRKKLNERAKLRSIQEFLFTWIDLIEPKVKQQIEAYTKMSSSIYLFEKVESPIKLNLHIDKFRSFSNEEVLKALVLSKRGSKVQHTNEYFILINNLSFIETKQENAFSNYDLMKTLGKDLVNEWNQNILALHEFRNKWFYNNHGSQKILPFYQIFRQFVDSKKDSLTDILLYYLNPSEELCHDFLSKEKDNKDVLEYFRLISFLQINYQKRKTNSEKIMSAINECKESSSTAWSRILEAKKYFTKTRYKIIV